MQYVLKYLCLSLAFLLPLTTHADFTGEVFFTKLVTKQEERKIFSEIWTTDIENAKSAHLLYRDEYEIHDYAIQKNGPLLVISAGPLTSDIFLLNRFQLGAGVSNLTKAKFGATAGVDISPNGDVLFSNSIVLFHEIPPIEGLYLIPNEELRKANPNVTLLKQGSIGYIQWSPDGHRFIYRTDKGLFLYNRFTREDSLITKDRLYPAFSPDGKKLAFIYQPILEPGVKIDVISLETLHPQIFPKDHEDHLRLSGLKWPKEKYFVYSVYDKQIKKTQHFVIRIDGGPPVQILKDVEDMFENGIRSFVLGNTTFAVEPMNRLTTLWGKLKQ